MSVHEVERLAASSSVRGDRARVRLTSGRAGIEFRLVKADLAEHDQFEAPDTDWRIAGRRARPDSSSARLTGVGRRFAELDRSTEAPVAIAV